MSYHADDYLQADMDERAMEKEKLMELRDFVLLFQKEYVPDGNWKYTYAGLDAAEWRAQATDWALTDNKALARRAEWIRDMLHFIDQFDM